MSEYEKVSSAIDTAIASLLFARETLRSAKSDDPTCSHPAIARRDLSVFGEVGQFVCGICEEIVDNE